MGAFNGKVALVTGAARGQGRSHAVRLAAEGADVVLLDICEQIASVPYPMSTRADLDETVALVTAAGREPLAIVADTRDASAVADAIAQTLERFGRLDIVIANAGICPLSTNDHPDAWGDVIDVNLSGTQNTLKAVIPAIQSGGRGGSVTIIGSGLSLAAGGTVSEGALGYIASKHGLMGLMRAYANQYAGESIRVNAILPSGVATPMVLTPSLEAYHESLTVPGAHRNAMPVDLMSPEDISDAVEWLSSDRARWVTGAAIAVDAGWLNS
ncbi:mycofactocin-coupled SDR family oxidoreductase [Microbacterium sp. X-17]|uniref:mycofactocin-coupled SDR family oxidoreductase n=1 Tax=Microbacterium sp. X-17 TaxID=3144404 RepID=UPI0031F580A1